MSLKPQLPGIDPVIGDLMERVGILEALSPRAALLISDGTVTVNPTDEIDFNPGGFVVTDAGGGIGQVALTDYKAFTPQLICDQGLGNVDPTLGANSSANALWLQRGDFVHYAGNILLGKAGFDPGVGLWGITLPIQESNLSQLGGQAWLKTVLASPEKLFPFIIDFGGANFAVNAAALTYTDALPFGNSLQFDGATTTWPFNTGTGPNGDLLSFYMIFRCV